MANIRDQIETMCFKPLRGGYVYRASSPWLFGRPEHYFVTQAQKADLRSAFLSCAYSRHPLFSDGLSFQLLCLAAAFVSLTMRFLIIAVRKTRAKEHTG